MDALQTVFSLFTPVVIYGIASRLINTERQRPIELSGTEAMTVFDVAALGDCLKKMDYLCSTHEHILSLLKMGTCWLYGSEL